MERLDALTAGKRVVQWGSVLGPLFSKEVLVEIWDSQAGELEAGLAELESSGLIRARLEGDRIRFEFKHALIQDAAYQSMVIATRQHIHARIAVHLKETSDRRSSNLELLAHHLTRAGSIDEAVHCWLGAGHAAASKFADGEAVVHFAMARDLLEK